MAGHQEPRIAAVGGGYWGKNIIRNLSQLGVLTAICDSEPGRLAQHQKSYPNIDCISDFNVIVNSKQFDAVALATPAATHFELVKMALIAGKDVFVEKPLAMALSQGEELAELAQKGSRILMVGHILRYHPAIRRIKDLIDNGDVGKVVYCYSNRLNLGKVRQEENILWSFAPHDISVLNYLMGGPPDVVHAFGEIILQAGIHDVTLTVLKWRSGVSAHINVSWLHPFKEHRFVVVGDKAMLVFDDLNAADKLVLYDSGIDFVKGAPVKRDDDKRVIAFDETEPLRAELEHFINCVQKRREPITNAREALDVLSVLTRAQLSLDA